MDRPPCASWDASAAGRWGGPSASRPRQRDDLAGVPFAVAARGGFLKGSLLIPQGAAPFPLVIIVAGAGPTDRNGNNYNVPGKCDSLKSLALALKDLGIASYRYDKRGAGESYILAGAEVDSRFDDYIDDAEAVFKAFESDARFSKILLIGHTEGALVAAAAAEKLASAAAKAPDGLVLLCASGKTAVESVNEGLATSPDDKKAEAAAIMDALEAGKTYPDPSAYFGDFFRPSFQPYLASWFRYDIKKEIAAWKGGLLLVQGNRDFQVTMAEFASLAAARPEAPALVLESMNHALKDVPRRPRRELRFLLGSQLCPRARPRRDHRRLYKGQSLSRRSQALRRGRSAEYPGGGRPSSEIALRASGDRGGRRSASPHRRSGQLCSPRSLC